MRAFYRVGIRVGIGFSRWGDDDVIPPSSSPSCTQVSCSKVTSNDSSTCVQYLIPFPHKNKKPLSRLPTLTLTLTPTLSSIRIPQHLLSGDSPQHSPTFMSNTKPHAEEQDCSAAYWPIPGQRRRRRSGAEGIVRPLNVAILDSSITGVCVRVCVRALDRSPHTLSLSGPWRLRALSRPVRRVFLSPGTGGAPHVGIRRRRLLRLPAPLAGWRSVTVTT